MLYYFRRKKWRDTATQQGREMKIMDMKRKRVVVIAVIVLAFAIALAACGGSGAANSDAKGADATTAGEAYALYKSASEALADAEGYTMDVKADIGSGEDGGDEAINTSSTSHIEVSDPTGNIGMKSVQTTEYAGEAMETTVYVKDGAVYTAMLDTKIKMEMDIPQLLKQSNNMVDFPEDAIIDGSVADVDGGKQITFKIKGDALSEYINQQFGDITGGITDDGAQDEAAGEDATGEILGGADEDATDEVLGGADGDSGITFEDSTITALIGPDGNFVEYTTEMSFAMNFGEIKTSMNQKSTVTNIKIGKVTIDFPSDLDTYEELDLGNIGDIE
jgi:hypothetical protein